MTAFIWLLIAFLIAAVAALIWLTESKPSANDPLSTRRVDLTALAEHQRRIEAHENEQERDR